MLALPVIEALAAARPRAPLTVATRRPALDVLDGHPAVHATIEVPASRKADRGLVRRLADGGFGAALLLSPSFRSALQAWRARIPRRIGLADDMRRALLTHVVGVRRGRPAAHQVRDYLDIALALGAVPESPVPRLRPAPPARRAAERVLEAIPPAAPVVALAPSAAGGVTKRWPLERFRDLGLLLVRRGVRVLIVGGPGDGRIGAALAAELERGGGAGGVVDLTGAAALPLAPLAALAPRVAALVTNDTGPMHVWAAGGGRVVAIFGSSLPGLHGPLGAGHRVLHRADLPCAGCYLPSCPRDLACLRGIEVRHVEEALRALQAPSHRWPGGSGEGGAADVPAGGAAGRVPERGEGGACQRPTADPLSWTDDDP